MMSLMLQKGKCNPILGNDLVADILGRLHSLLFAKSFSGGSSPLVVFWLAVKQGLR